MPRAIDFALAETICCCAAERAAPIILMTGSLEYHWYLLNRIYSVIEIQIGKIITGRQNSYNTHGPKNKEGNNRGRLYCKG